MKSIKTAYKSCCVYLIVLLSVGIFFAVPSVIFGASPEYSGCGLFYKNHSEDIRIFGEIKSSGVGPNFLPVIITSIIVLGILVFAMWQTFKSKRLQ